MSIGNATLQASLKNELNNKLDSSNVVNNLTTNVAGYALDARQGRLLNSALDNKVSLSRYVSTNFDLNDLIHNGTYYFDINHPKNLPSDFNSTNVGVIEIYGSWDASGIIIQRVTDVVNGKVFSRTNNMNYTWTNWVDITPFYVAGDTVSLTWYCTGGFITNSGTDVYFMFPLTKSTDQVSSVSVSGFTGSIRNNSTYIHGSSSGHASITNYTATLRSTFIQFKVTVSVTGSTNNNAVGIQISEGTVTFK